MHNNINNNNIRYSEQVLWYKTPAKNFNESLPLGNGRIGACVYGGTKEETISLNEETLWSGYPNLPDDENYFETYQKIRELTAQNKLAEAQRLSEEKFGGRLGQMYLSLGKLKIESYDTGSVSDYSRTLFLDEAIQTVKYRCGEKVYNREYFISKPDEVMAIHFSCSELRSVSFEIFFVTPLKAKIFREKNRLCISGKMPNAFVDYGTYYNKPEALKYSDSDAEQGIAYLALISVSANGGETIFADNKITVKNANSATVYLSVRTNFEAWNKHPAGSKIDYKTNARNDLKRVSDKAYSALKKESISAYQSLYERSDLTFYGSKNGTLETDERLYRLESGEEDNSLYALIFNYAKYLMISSCGKETQPMNLQGIWNEKLCPKWACSYTLNINTQMNYWPALPFGLFECYESLVNMTEELAESGRKTAEMFYGAPGWVCHHNTDIWRLTYPVTNRVHGSSRWGVWPMASGWLCVMLWDYYRYTLDKEYLKRIYPVMSGAGEFYKHLLSFMDGEYILSPATSPENAYIGEDGQCYTIDYSTAMTQEILYDLFSALSKAEKILGLDDEYSKICSKLRKPRIQSDGTLCEWYSEHPDSETRHRHISHLYGLFPSNQFNEEQKKACERSLVERGDEGTGWSMAWKINLWARLRGGEHSLKLLNNQLKLVDSECETTDSTGGSYPNLFCAHPPFQIDGNFGAANGIIEMLIQIDNEGNPIYLPALPKSWVRGKISGIRIYGGKTVSFSWDENKLDCVKIEEDIRDR